MCGAPYTTQFLADCIRGRKLMTLEAAVRAMSDTPAKLFGLHRRGRIAAGYHADLVLFDPKIVGSGPIVTRADLPGGSARLFAEATGVRRVLVNGRAIVVDGVPTDERPGRILRSGRDTHRTGIADA
jgi:N-acyl-D-aspartate/D-glutamate deacylase